MSELRIDSLVLGMVSTNCYLIYNDRTREAVIVDPADSAPRIKSRCGELQLQPRAVLLTHGHGDHILAAKDICRAYDISLYAGRKEAGLLKDPSWNLSDSLGLGSVSLEADVWVDEGEHLQLAGFDWQVIETPGHTKGSVCYYIAEEEVLISGDTLFAGSLGRTDFPGGSMREIVDSITGKLLVLPDEVMVYPGHGEQTSIGFEKKYNPVAVYMQKH